MPGGKINEWNFSTYTKHPRILFAIQWKYLIVEWAYNNKSRPTQNGHHSADSIFNYILFNENVFFIESSSIFLNVQLTINQQWYK